MTADAEVAAGLRAWAQGSYPEEAAVELLVRAMGGRFAAIGWPWIGSDASGAYWLEPDAIQSGYVPLSGGERRLLMLVGSLAGCPLSCDLGDCLSGLDRTNLALVLAAFAHAAGSHRHVTMINTGTGLLIPDVPGPLIDWPEQPREPR